ncbi:FAD binding domain protein [Bisporella sp. PMI_857]|nr:FAD binding domain protein [Bisporella sp. PMI_857]
MIKTSHIFPAVAALARAVAGITQCKCLNGYRSACYQSEPNYNEAICETVIAEWHTNEFHSSNPVSLQSPYSVNSTCNPIYPNGTSTSGDPDAGRRGCSLGEYPPYVINATEASHVQAAKKFATRHNLRLVVKGTGHGGDRSAGYGSLSIWTHHMKNFEFHETFQARACSHSDSRNIMAATAGAGTQDYEAFQNAAKYNAVVVGSANKDVGLVGWPTGGGHRYFTQSYGMGADNILEAIVVTPKGEIVVANACQHPDLFWAIRGRGGGTSGIITQLTLKAFPMSSTAVWNFEVSNRNNTDAVQLPGIKRQGVQGYYTVSGPPSSDSLRMHGVFLLHGNSTVEGMKSTVTSLDLRLRRANQTASYTSQTIPIPTWIKFYNSLPELNSAAALTEDVELLARVLRDIGPKLEPPTVKRCFEPYHAGCMISSAKSVDNSLNPDWRDTVVHMITSVSWKDSVPAEVQTAAIDDMTHNKGHSLRRLDPDSGVYLNEPGFNEPNWQAAFWSTNYPHLAAIKQTYDPEQLLWCDYCVGSEGWARDDNGKLCRQSWA